MKDTGIVRRIDDLGRVVIPKELRKSLFLKEGTALEIHMVEEGILLKKHDVLKTISDIASVFCEVIYSCLQFPTLVTDTRRVLASEGVSKKAYLHKELSGEVKNMIIESQNYMASAKDKTTLYPIVVGEEEKDSSTVKIIAIVVIIVAIVVLIIFLRKRSKKKEEDLLNEGKISIDNPTDSDLQ